jgi:histidinol-phosphate/aromatic aminotransferase/cobyric acid decarboxylase-like protein
MDRSIRFTVGRQEDNDRLLEALPALLEVAR